MAGVFTQRPGENKLSPFMKTIVKVLHLGAHEELMMNYYRHFKTGRVRFDYVLPRGKVDFRFKSDPKFDGKLYYVTPLSTSPIKWILDVIRILRAEPYRVVHMHLGFANIYGLIACLFAPTVRIKICHSHNFYEPHSFLSGMFRLISKIVIHLLSTKRFACSNDAGRQMFYKDFSVMKNVIDYSKFIYNEEKRSALRKSLDLVENFVVGHVGYFLQQKNHSFLIDVFALLLQKIPEARLMLIGADYGTMEEVRSKSNKLGILDKVVFMGERPDVSDLLQAMDCFVFPSLFEGFGMALLEAQVSGLKCFYSSSIPSDAIVSNFATRLDLAEGPLHWANAVHQYYLSSHNRNGNTNLINSDFDAVSQAQTLESFYLKLKD